MKIAVVDLKQAVAQSAQGKELQKKLMAFQRKVHNRIHAESQELHELRNRIANEANTLSPPYLARLRREYDEGNANLQRFRDEKTREGEQLQQEGLENIKRQLPSALHKLRAENDYDLILHSEAVLLAAEDLDVTDSVVAKLSQIA